MTISIWVIISVIITILIIKKYKSKKVLSENSKKDYKDLLKREEWREKRAKILNRDNHKCKYCGEVHNLQVHHKYYCQYPNGYRVRPWNYPDDALITLCDKCHTKVHNKKKIKVYYRSYSENY